jgi:hypothetical protein
MNGTKSYFASKWAQLESEVLQQAKVNIALICETRLMNVEQPPNIEGYVYAGSNRWGQSGRQSNGGVGILLATEINTLWTERGDDWVAQAVVIGEVRLILLSLYLCQTTKEKNIRTLNKISTFIENKLDPNDCLLCAGDWNAHLPQLDGKSNFRGSLLEQFSTRHGLTILNTTDLCHGLYTRKTAAIDYILTNSNATAMVVEMQIDENRNITTISDHNLILLKCRVEKMQVKPQVRKWTTLDSRKAAKLTEDSISCTAADGDQVSYKQFKAHVFDAMQKSSRTRTASSRPMVWSKTLSKLKEIRRNANRKWRHARKNNESEDAIQAAILNLRTAQQAVREEVVKLMTSQQARLRSHILSAPRGERGKRFWRWVRRTQSKRRTTVKLKNEKGEIIPDTQITQHLSEVAKKVLNASNAPMERQSVRLSGPSEITVTAAEIKRTLASMQKCTSPGMDKIPASVLKDLSELGHEYIAQLFNQILDGTENFPEDWAEGRVTMVEKTNSIVGNFLTYRPITISPVICRLIAKILGYRIQQWIEENKILGEMQNGFRPKRRGDDNLFILTSAIELSRTQKEGLVCAFIDASAAYDRVDRTILWNILSSLGMDQRLIEVLQALYVDTRLRIQSEDNKMSDWMTTDTGLRQGCPLSSTLFMLYIAGLETRLLKSGVGWRVRYKGDFWNAKQKKYFTMPGLLFADDLVLMGRNAQELQKLLDITTKFGDERKLVFNPQKSAVVVFSSNDVGNVSALKLQGKTLPVDHNYKYLGIYLDDSVKYLTKQEEIWSRKATTCLNQMHAQSLWGFDRFEISRVQWKATAVPALTYGNAVTKMSRQVEEKLEKAQRDAGRWALGLPGSKLANEFVSGELGWSTFRARSAQSKIRFFTRIRSMEDHRWPKAVLNMMDLLGVKTSTYTEMETLRQQYCCSGVELEVSQTGTPLLGRFNARIKEKVRQALDDAWQRGMLSKSSLLRYRSYKRSRGTDQLYCNSRGSALLAMARAGMLPTRCQRARSEPGIDQNCVKCGMESETLEHVIFECNEIYYTEEDLLKRLGFHEEREPALVAATRKLLEKWELETRRIR